LAAFAAFTYWFPNSLAFRLNETLGKFAFGFWLSGFLAAFLRLYVLVLWRDRRLDHYDASLGWQGLFVVAAIGIGLIFIGVGFQILQNTCELAATSQRRDITGDPWNGRTLEWATTSRRRFITLPAFPKSMTATLFGR